MTIPGDDKEKIVKMGRAAAALLANEVYQEVFAHTKGACLEHWWAAREGGVEPDPRVSAAATGFAAMDGKLRTMVEAGAMIEREE